MPQSTLRRRSAVVIAALALAALNACGDSANPVQEPVPRVVSLQVVPGTSYLTIGSSTELSVEATWSNGNRERMQATWGSDNTQVATVAGSGQVTGVGPGEATISGDCSHGRATLRLRVLPEYRGSWGGAYVLRACTQTGDWAAERVCEEMPVGQEAPLGLRLERNEARVTGTLMLGLLSGDASGQIEMPGHLALTAQVRFEEEGETLNIAVSDWNTFAQGDQMTGRFVQTWTVPGVNGAMRWECDLASCTRTSQTLQAPALPWSPGRAGRGLADRVRRLIGVRR